MVLLDTNVISEIIRERPDPAVLTWLRAHPREEFWTSSVVVAELLSGIDLMPAGRKQRALREAVEGMIAEDLRGQILKFDVSAARHYGQILATRQQIGRPTKEMDALIAATALANGASLATRNTSDFENCGIQLVNPWS
jgi:predicted nucleic acid-binding protein